QDDGRLAGQEKQPSPLAQPIVEAWTKAGAKAGWLRPEPSIGYVGFLPASAAARVGDVPGFKIAWREGVVAKLLPPQQPFGLDRSETDVTDAGVKELAGLKSLQALNLFNTKLTDAGLKELAGLKSLQTLDLSFTQVTDAGLKELGGLKGLQTLYLTATQ